MTYIYINILSCQQLLSNAADGAEDAFLSFRVCPHKRECEACILISVLTGGARGFLGLFVYLAAALLENASQLKRAPSLFRNYT